MKLSEIKNGSALLVKPTGLSIVKPGDEVLLCVRGCMDKDSVFVPYNESLQISKTLLNDCIGREVFILKQDKSLSDDKQGGSL